MKKLSAYFLNVGKGNRAIADFPSGRLTVIDIDDSKSIPYLDELIMEGVGKSAEITNPIINGLLHKRKHKK